MKIIKLAGISIPANRQRKEFDPESLSNLCDDIAINGLQHAPVVRATPAGHELVSGERRYRVIRDLASAGVSIRYGSSDIPLDYIPVTDFGELSPRQAKILELHENIEREDLKWQERIAAEAELHEIRSEEAFERGAVQTYTATAEELAGRPLAGSTEQAYASTQVRQSVVISKHMADPEVAKAATAKDALKVIQKKETEQHYKNLALTLGTQQTSSRHTLLRGDAKQLMPGLAAATFDCLLCDPPYGVDAQNFGSQMSKEHKFDDSYRTWLILMDALAQESFRFCKAQAHGYVFCDPRNFTKLGERFTAAGWNVWPTPLIWDKSTGMLPRPEHGPRRTYEAVLYAIKGDKTTTGIFSDVLRHTAERTTIHPDQKPVALYADLLRRSTRPGNLVIDPFCGSGTIFVAANQLQLTAIGIDVEETSYALSAERLKEKGTL